MNAITRVESVNHLKKILQKGDGEFFIALNYGCRSSKYLSYDRAKDLFTVENCIDGSEQRLSSREIMSKSHTNIGLAIRKGAFYFEEAI